MTWALRVFMNSITYGVADVLNFAANLFCIYISIGCMGGIDQLTPGYYDSLAAELKTYHIVHELVK